jgi:hypothetical protein
MKRKWEKSRRKLKWKNAVEEMPQIYFRQKTRKQQQIKQKNGE